MFGFATNIDKRVRKTRKNFDALRSRVLNQMNAFEQYSFGTVFDHVPDEIGSPMRNTPLSDKKSWELLSKELLAFARGSYRQFEKISGLAGEGGRAGAEGVYLLSLLAEANSFEGHGAETLRNEISTFQKLTTAFVNAPENRGKPLPQGM